MMINKKDKIVFFSSGDFAIPTFQRLLECGYNVVGLVTSNDKVYFNDKKLITIAKENDIPFCIPNDLNDDDFITWLQEKEADIFCVISYKKLPDNIIKMPSKVAFNVHASVLPFLRGAAPINWAIRLGFEETGLTAFELTDKIDCGNIIDVCIEKINEDDNFGTLFQRLSQKCVTFVQNLLDNTFTQTTWKTLPQVNIGGYSELLKAPKINNEYFRPLHYVPFDKMIKSLSPINGVPCSFIITKVYEGSKEDDVDIIDAKIYDAEIVKQTENYHKLVKSDGKSYLYVYDDRFCGIYEWISVKEIQIAGKKRLKIEEFLRGFQYFKDKNKIVSLIFD